MQNKLFVRNLSFDCADAHLLELFSNFGEVGSANVAVDRDTGRSRGFGFVEMANQQQAEAAMRGLEGREFRGRQIHVAIAEPREKKPKGYGRGRW